MQSAQQILSIAFEMSLPPGVGFWLDTRWGTKPWLVIVGAVFGFLVAMWHVWKIANPATAKGDTKVAKQSGKK
jgi:F0F1-type ATP synthase assembly protein I